MGRQLLPVPKLVGLQGVEAGILADDLVHKAAVVNQWRSNSSGAAFSQRAEQRGSVRTAEPGTGVPTGAGLVGPVAALSHVAQHAGQAGVEQWIQISHAHAQSFVDTGDESRPE